MPHHCLVCDAPAEAPLDLCRQCLDRLPVIHHGCYTCGIPLPTGYGELLCGQCLKRPPPQAQTISLYEYSEPVSGLITRLKFHAELAVARSLGELMLQRLRVEVESVDMLLPVPLHPARLRQRGFNQSVELARPLARGLDLPLEHQLVRRVRNTAAQSELDAIARRRNLRSAFEVLQPPGKHVAVIDDVVTTGSTVASLSRCLLCAGAERVSVWSLARALPK